jgi:hypothetical protein
VLQNILNTLFFFIKLKTVQQVDMEFETPKEVLIYLTASAHGLIVCLKQWVKIKKSLSFLCKTKKLHYCLLNSDIMVRLYYYFI